MINKKKKKTKTKKTSGLVGLPEGTLQSVKKPQENKIKTKQNRDLTMALGLLFQFSQCHQ